MPDNSIWTVPICIIAQNRAEYYKDDFDGSIKRSLDEDTLPFFAQNGFEVIHWATNNMNWDEVKDYAILVKKPETDYQEGWLNGEKDIKESPDKYNHSYNDFYDTEFLLTESIKILERYIASLNLEINCLRDYIKDGKIHEQDDTFYTSRLYEKVKEKEMYLWQLKRYLQK